MRRTVAYPMAALGAAVASLAVVSPAQAHGYVSAPPSRQALCAEKAVPDCGPIQFEPQSVEGPKGLSRCDGGLSQFSVLADESRNWPARAVGSQVTFTWVMTARHRTTDWQYFVGGQRVATVDGGNAQPEAVETHSVNLSAFPGRRTVLAVWNIADTGNAFYSCIDLNVGGGSDSAPPAADPDPEPATEPAAPDPAPVATSAPRPADGGWSAGVSYRTGDVVSFGGAEFRCRQGHQAIPGWQPSAYTQALWLPL